MRKLTAALFIAVVVAGGFTSEVVYAHHKEDHGSSVAVGAKPGRSNPDENGNGPERDGGLADPAGEMAPHDNNGCGNDANRIDDNEGWCGRKPKTTPTPADTPESTSTPELPPSDTPVPTSTPEPLPPADTPEPLPPASTPEPPVSQPPVDVPEHTPPGIQEDWEDVKVGVCLSAPAQPQQTRVITVFVRVPVPSDDASVASDYGLAIVGLMVVGYVAKRRIS